MTKTEDAILETLTHMNTALAGVLDRVSALESTPPEASVVSHDAAVATKSTPKTTRKVTTITADDPELLALRGQITREGKAKLIDKCAIHSADALRTLILAGGREARAFMAGSRTAAKAEETYHMVDSVNGRYAREMLARLESGKGATVVTSHSKAASPPKPSKRGRKATRTVNTAHEKLSADMTNTQLLKHRPKGQSTKPAATNTWLWRTRERIAGRDPMRARS